MELGVYSFGSVQRDPATGEIGSTAEGMRNLVEGIALADEVGLDYFGIGEHHTREMPASAAAVILGAGAAATKRIRLGSSVTVLSTDDPVRIFQQFATVDSISGGRAEITAGRGSSTESFPLFGYDLADYDRLYAEKLELLLALNERERVTWSGTVRAPLHDALVVPRPERGRLPIWLGTGGSPASSARAGQLGMPIAYGIIGGYPARFAPLVDLYRRSAAASGAPEADIRVAVANPGYLDTNAARARDTWWTHWDERARIIAPVRGFTPPGRDWFDQQTAPDAAFYVGEPEEIAERIIRLHGVIGHVRQFLEVDYGHLPQRDFLHTIELLGTRVKPMVDEELGRVPAAVASCAPSGSSALAVPSSTP